MDATSCSVRTPIWPATSDAPSIGMEPSGITVAQCAGSGVAMGAATILRFGASLSTSRNSLPSWTPSGP